MRMATLYLRLKGKAMARPERFSRELATRSYPEPDPISKKIHQRYAIRTYHVGGWPVLEFSPRAGATENQVVFVHGGGYVFQAVKQHWFMADELSRALDASVLMPVYPLAPEHGHAEAFAFLDTVADDARARCPGRLYLAGDSAGGALALGMAMRGRDAGKPAADGLALFSPWVDATMANPEAAALEKADVFLAVPPLIECGRLWAGGLDTAAPDISPLYGRLSGLPPMAVFQGTADILMPDSRLFARRVREAGGRIDYHEYPGAFHDFVGATFAPEAQDAFAKLAAWRTSLA